MSKPTLWDKVDREVLTAAQTSSSATSEPAVPKAPKRFRRTRRILRDTAGLLVWLYIFLQLFVFDVDRHIIERAIPGAHRILQYKILIVLGCIALVILLWRRLLLPFLYVVGFPFVVLFWKLPRFLYRVRSGTVVLGLINVITSALTNFRYNFLSAVLWLTGAVFSLTSHSALLLWPSIAFLSVTLARSFVRTLRFSFMPSRFVTLQTKAITAAASQRFTNTLTQVDDLKSDAIEKFDQTQLQRFFSAMQMSIVANRFLYTWAYQLDQYRRGPLPYIFSFASYIWLFLSTLMSLSFINIALLHLSASQFTFPKPPSVVEMIHYTLASLVVSAVSQVDAAKTAAQIVQILGGVLGPALALTVVSNVLFNTRTTRQEVPLQEAVATIKQRGNDLRTRFHTDFDVTMDDALARLQELGTTTFLGIISFLSKQFPDDFVG